MAVNNNFILPFFSIVFAFLLLTGSISAQAEEEFDYEEGSSRGPEHWGDLNYPKWKTCREGKMQSPIDFQSGSVTVSPGLGRLKTKYRAAHAVLKNRGHDIMVEWTEHAGYIFVGKTKYFLNQSHWHSPSEHRLNNKRYDLEMHMVHKSNDGRIAVIGILYRIGFHSNRFLGELTDKIRYLAINRNQSRSVDAGVVDPLHAEVGNGGYYRYNGSLTSPPCTEGVIWTVMKDVHSVAPCKIHALQTAVDPGFQHNARPIQPINCRKIWLYKQWRP